MAEIDQDLTQLFTFIILLNFKLQQADCCGYGIFSIFFHDSGPVKTLCTCNYMTNRCFDFVETRRAGQHMWPARLVRTAEIHSLGQKLYKIKGFQRFQAVLAL